MADITSGIFALAGVAVTLIGRYFMFFMFKVDAVRGDFRNESLDKTIIALREAIRTHLKALENPARPHEFRTNLRLSRIQRRK